MFEVVSYNPSTTCIGCDAESKECVILKTEAFVGPHCQKCVMREARKRAKNGSSTEAANGCKVETSV